MKVLMMNRPNSFALPGGDTVQMLETKSELEESGVIVDVSVELEPDFKNYDIVHVFNIQARVAHNSFKQILAAKSFGIPVVVSTIYWDWKDPEFSFLSEQKKSFGIKSSLNNLVNQFFGFEINRRKTLQKLGEKYIEKGKKIRDQELIEYFQRSCLLLSDLILPNSELEYKKIINDFNLSENVLSASIIPNGINKNVFNFNEGEFFDDQENLVLCVGRIEPTKNQLNLIKAMAGLGLKLVLVGKISHINYAELCKSEAQSCKVDVKFIDHIDYSDLPSLYRKAKIHALVSYRETPGLANLEAGFSGCNLVLTPNGTTREYFGNYAWYCDPDDVQSIRRSLVEANNAPKDLKLSNHIGKNFTWEIAAIKTKMAYESVISKKQ